MIAEDARRQLKDLIESRDVEREVMKDDPDWIVGESVFFSRRCPVMAEFYESWNKIFFESSTVRAIHEANILTNFK